MPPTPPDQSVHGYLFAAFQNSPIAVAVIRTGTVIDVNDAFTSLTGWPRAEVAGRLARDTGLLSATDASAIGAELQRGTPVRDRAVTLFTRDGRTRDVQLGASSVTLGGVTHVIATFVDLTEHRRVEQELRASEERFRLIAETISEVFWIADIDIQDTVYVSPAYERVWGRPCRSLLERPRSFLQAVHPDDLAQLLQTLSERQVTRQPFEHEYRIVLPDGTIRWIWDRGFPVTLDGAHVRHYVGVAQDVTQRKQREEQLRNSVERFELVSRATHDAVWDYDLKTGEAWWSETFYDKYGLSRAQPPDFDGWASHLHPDDRERVTASFVQAIRGERQEWHADYRYRLADGTYATVIDRAHIVRDDNRVALRVSGVMEDITKYLDLQRQLQQAAKMEAVGHLAGGVAHDFNNILTVIQGHAALIATSDAVPADSRESAGEIAAAAKRAASLTQQLLLFSRKQVLQRTSFDVNGALVAMGKMLSRILGEDIQLEFELSPEPLVIDADAGMVDQIVLNLSVNARDAMTSGGVLAIATSEVLVDGTQVPAGGVPGRYARLTVHDTGGGIPADVLPHIFEPFFSTKTPDKGTGLGLSTVFGIVKQHDGWVDVQSEDGEGSSFHVFLPLSASPSVMRVPDERTSSIGGTETVLLVEDEPAVLALMGTALERKGYRILKAATALEATTLWRAHPDVRLLVTDLVLPGGVGGRELAATLCAERPDLKVLLVSGYSADLSGTEIRQEPGRHFLQKPFTPDLFVDRVRACLDSAA
jgi:PAS domain S-box-containing protein